MTFIQPAASHFINGRYVDDTNGPVLELIYPANGQPLGQLHAATPAIVEEALASAKQAQKAWAATSGTQRGRILRRAADMIRAQNHALSVLETYDTGKPLSETLCADATSGADALEYFGDLAGSLTGDNIQLGEDWVYTNREALGSVSEVEHGIIPLKSPVGKQPLRWHAAIQWCSNHQRQHRYVL